MNPNSERVRVVGVASIFFLAYLAGTSQIYSYADDSLAYVTQAFLGSPLVVHHLIVAIFGALVRGLGLTERPDFIKVLWIMKTYVAATAALALYLVGVSSLRWFGSIQIAIFSMIFAGVTYGFWAYSIVPDLYVPATAFALLAIYLADRSYDTESPARAYALLASASLAILAAALNHQSHGIQALPMAFVLGVWNRGGLSRAARARRALFFLSFTGAIGLGSFYFAYSISGVEDGFVQFLRGYSAWMHMLPYDKAQVLTPLYALVGIARAIVFPEFALRYDGAYEAVQRHFQLKLLLDERYLLRGFSPGFAAALLVLNGLLLAALAVVFVRGAWAWFKRPPRKPGLWMLIAWIPLQAVFFSIWEATSNEFWIWLMPCLALIAGGMAAVAWEGSKGFARAAILFLAGLFAANVCIIGNYWSEKNCIYRVNKRYLAALNKEDLVVATYTYSMNKLAFLRPETALVHEFMLGSFTMDDPELRAQLVRVEREGGRVFIDPVLAMPHSAENGIMLYQTRVTRPQVESSLLELEEYAKERGIPLFAIERETSGVVELARPEFHDYVRWVEGSAEVP